MTAAITDTDIHYHVVRATDASEGSYDVDGIVATIIERHGLVDVDTIDHDAFWTIVIEHAALTARITESVSTFFVQDPDGAEGELVQRETTHAVIEDGDGEEISDFSGPVSEDWDEAAWDVALTEAGYRRVGDWNVSEGTAPVVSDKTETGA